MQIAPHLAQSSSLLYVYLGHKVFRVLETQQRAWYVPVWCATAYSPSKRFPLKRPRDSVELMYHSTPIYVRYYVQRCCLEETETTVISHILECCLNVSLSYPEHILSENIWKDYRYIFKILFQKNCSLSGCHEQLYCILVPNQMTIVCIISLLT